MKSKNEILSNTTDLINYVTFFLNILYHIFLIVSAKV